MIVIENHEREHAYGEADLRVLTTIGATMGVALENARLFDETQRRERESTALSEVGRDLSSTLDLATVMDRIAAHAKELLAAQSSAIFLPDARAASFRAIVALGDLADALKATAIEPGQGIIGSLLQSGQAEFINDTGRRPARAADRRAPRRARRAADGRAAARRRGRCWARWRCGAAAAARSRRASWRSWTACRARR